MAGAPGQQVYQTASAVSISVTRTRATCHTGDSSRQGVRRRPPLSGHHGRHYYRWLRPRSGQVTAGLREYAGMLARHHPHLEVTPCPPHPRRPPVPAVCRRHRAAANGSFRDLVPGRRRGHHPCGAPQRHLLWLKALEPSHVARLAHPLPHPGRAGLACGAPTRGGSRPRTSATR